MISTITLFTITLENLHGCIMAGKKKITTSKREISERKILVKKLPYYNYTGSVIMLHGQYNNSLMYKHQPAKYDLQNLPSPMILIIQVKVSLRESS